MEAQTVAKPKRGKRWPILFAVLGASNLLDYHFNPEKELHDLLLGAGFLFAVPWFYYEPISLSNPSLDTATQPSHRLAKAIGLIGVALLILGLAVELA